MRITKAIVGGGARRPRGQAAGTARVRAAVAVVGALIAALLLSAPAVAAGPRTLAGLRASLNAQIAKAGPRSGAYVVDLSTGRTLYDVRSRTRLIPASLEKLYTTSAALMSLGPDTHLSTDMLGAGRRVGATWEGDIYLRGSGDFTYGSASFNRRAYGGGGTVQALALALRGEGITQIRGSVLGDSSLFADGPGRSFSLLLCSKPLFGPGCPYGPAGKFTRPLPNGPRSAVPADRGLLNSTSAKAQTHPALFAARQLVEQLRRAGISVTGHPGSGRAPRSSRVLATTSSPTVAQLAALTNKPSDNYAAEMMFRVLGARSSGTGSRASGAAAVSAIIARRFGIRPRIYNGSGESRLNRTSPRELVRLLIGMSKQPVASQFESSLPVVGRSGTLSDRLRGTVAAGRCQAKDGTLTSPLVGTAAGYCSTVGGHSLAVAIMTNGIPIHFDPVKKEIKSQAFTIEDRMLTALAGFRATPKSSVLVLSPRPGQVVRANSVQIRLQVPNGRYVVQGRLNGAAIQGSLVRQTSRVRTLNASISHGLRRSTNVLRVQLLQGATVVRKATVRFRITPNSALVGAGRDRFVVVGQPVDLRGSIANPAGRLVNAVKASSRWRMVSGPRRSPGAKTLPLASLRSPSGPTAGFTPTALGSYTLQFSAGKGRNLTSDRVTLNAIPPAPMVTVDTMSTQGSTPGITVNGKFYAKPGSNPLQVLVFHRDTLEYVSNNSYGSAAGLSKDLNGVDDSYLVIVSQHADAHNGAAEPELSYLLTNRLGFPKSGPMNPTQWWSGIAVPGMKPGEAGVNVDLDPSGAGSAGNLGLKGYLARDANLEFTFVPSSQVPFSYTAPGVPGECVPVGFCSAGYTVKIQNARTLEVTSDKRYVTDQSAGGNDDLEAGAMLADLNKITGADRLVTITSFSSRPQGDSQYLPPVSSRPPSQHGVSQTTMDALADAVARLGGTHNAFNLAALAHGAPGTKGFTYALVGWVGAGEAKGVESASGQHGASADSPATLSGTLRPDNQSSYRPVEASDEPDVTNKLSQLVWSPPGKAVPSVPKAQHDAGCLTTAAGERWPLDNNPGAQAAIQYLARTDSRLGDDPRVQYWHNGGDEARWDNIADGIDKQTYPDHAHYSKEDFDKARGELSCEMRLVGRVKSFVADLSKPFSATTDWTDTQKIAADVYEQSHKPEGSATMSWLEFTNLLLEAGSPFTGHVSGAIAAFMKVGMWAFGDNEDGSSAYADFNVEASKLAAEIVSQAQTSVKTVQRMGDIIVSDYAKLVEVGSNANCVPRKDFPEGCPEEFQFNQDDQTHMETATSRAIQALAYEELVPIGWRVYELNGTKNAHNAEFKQHPPHVNQYHCDVGYTAFYRYGDDSKASTWLLQDADPAGQRNNYITFAVAEDPGHSQYATAPPNEVLDRMFGKLSASNDPNKGGLAIDPVDFMSEAPHHAWWRGTIGNDPCWWGSL
jgi:serine-type D-Ala-D-Ala carboxypeptidase/endopeptidase (penicillin-binding protein 4)